MIFNAKIREVFRKYDFISISEAFKDDNYGKILLNFKESPLIIINQKASEEQSDNEYFIISFHKTLIIVKKSSISLLQSLFSTKPKLKICFLSKTKEKFDEQIKINYDDIKNDQYFFEEVSKFRSLITINDNTYIMSMIAYLIKESYNKLNYNRIQNFFNQTENISQTENFDENDFLVLRRIGLGSFFMTDLVYHIKQEKLFVFKRPKISDDEGKKLTDRQIKNCSKIKHPFLPNFYGNTTKDNILVIEYIKGQTLTNIEQKHLQYNEKITIIFELMIAIEYLHENKFIYRDLKPDNIMIDDNKNAVLIDFDRMIENNNQDFTHIYTPGFIAPEIDTDKITNKCDIYSLGKIMYYIITEKQPSLNNSNEFDDFAENKKMYEIYKKCVEIDESKRPTIRELIKEFDKEFCENIKIDHLLQQCDFYFRNLLLFNDFVIIKNNDFYQPEKKDRYIYFNGKYLEPLVVHNYYYVSMLGNMKPDKKLYSIGITFYERKDCYDLKKAIYFLTLSADLNYVHAQFMLGVIYFNHELPSFNVDRAAFYFTLSSHQNHPTAQYNLAIIHSKKEYPYYDINKAIYYYTMSANNNLAEAQFNLANFYSYNSDDPSKCDANKAIHYYLLAVKQNHVGAQHNLGLLYYHGKIVPININKAIYYLSLAAKQNNAESLYTLGNIYSEGDYVKKDINKAIYYYSLAVDLNHDKSMVSLGYIYYNGNGVKKDINKAISYFTRSSELKNSNAQFQLGYIYYKIDIQKSIHYYTLSADNNNIYAMNNLSGILLTCKKIKRDVKKALYYLNLAANKNSSSAQYFLGIIYYEGKYVPRDINKAIYYYTLAANQNNPQAQNNLGLLYADETLDQYDLDKAIYYFTLASYQNLKQALVNLAIYIGKKSKSNLKISIYLLNLAAKQKYRMAYYNLGFLYYGKNEFHDINKAIYYFTLAADKNHTLSQLYLGFILINNDGIKINPKQGLYYLLQASKNHNIVANFIVGSVYHEGKIVKRDIKKAIYYYKEASSFDNKYAKNNLGIIYKNGYGSIINKNLGFAFQYFDEAIKQKNDVLSMYNLARIYLFEFKNIDNAIKLLTQIADINFKNYGELLCLALIMKFYFNFENYKREIAIYTENSMYLYNLICETINNLDLYVNYNFEARCKYYEQTDLIYNSSMEIISFGGKLNDEIKNQKNINKDFYYGFGIH